MTCLIRLLVGLCAVHLLHAAERLPPTTAISTIEDFALLDERGHLRHLYYEGRDKATRAVVLFVQGNGCPLVQKLVPDLNQLKADYAAQGVVFWMINANSQDTREEIVKEVQEFGIHWPVLQDSTQLVAEALKLERTCEALLIDPKGWKIAYRGAVTDRLSYQAEKGTGFNNHLRTALDELLQDRPVAAVRTEFAGCRIVLTDADRVAHREISYSKTIAPLLAKRCAHCHTEGGLAPWSMSSYRKVLGWSEMMREVVMTRQMPPWQADPHRGSFANDFSLSQDETRTLVHWIQAGAPRGEGPDPLEALHFEKKEWQLGKPDHIIEVGEQSVPAQGVIDYRYVTIESPFPEDVWIRAVEINPGNTKVLHHVIVTAHLLKDGKKTREKSIAGYAPGMGPDVFPTGTGVRLRKGSQILFQLHYTVSGRPEMDATRLGLYLSPQPMEKELQTRVVMETKFKIPAGDREFVVTKTNVFDSDAILHSMNPHMHFRGKRMHYEARYPDGSKEVLLSVPNYHFNWQRSYKLREPKFVPKGTAIVVEAAWDNSSLNTSNPDPTRDVSWGEQSWDEMFFASYQFTVEQRRAGDPAKSAQEKSPLTSVSAPQNP